MFSKTSIQIFVYDLIDVFMFPDEDVKKFMRTTKLKNASCSEFNRHRQYFIIFYFCLQTFIFS